MQAAFTLKKKKFVGALNTDKALNSPPAAFLAISSQMGEWGTSLDAVWQSACLLRLAPAKSYIAVWAACTICHMKTVQKS